MNNRARLLHDQVIMLHREPGYLRFLLPKDLCGEAAAAYLVQAIGAREGVRRVRVYRSTRKIAISYMETVCSYYDVARSFGSAVAIIAEGAAVLVNNPASTKSSPLQKLKAKANKSPFLSRWRGRLEGARSTLGLVARTARRKAKSHEEEAPKWEKMAIVFLNDVAVFYLIKVHWKLITEKWLKAPIRHRYQWMTVFYLVFLTVRYKKQNKEPKA